MLAVLEDAIAYEERVNLKHFVLEFKQYMKQNPCGEITLKSLYVAQLLLELNEDTIQFNSKLKQFFISTEIMSDVLDLQILVDGKYEKLSGKREAMNDKPNPDRFKDYKLNEDKSGFSLPGCDYEFYFDEFGGWYDEFDNYYLKGVPCEWPIDF